MFILLTVLCCRAGAGEANNYTHLGERLRAKIDSMDWGGGKLGVLVEDAQLPIKALAINENEPLAPGGLMQIITAAVALDQLGPDFRFKTEFGLSGKVADGTLTGRLVARGDGDPSISGLFLPKPEDVLDTFDGWAKRLRERGVRRVTGSVIGEASAFDNEWYAPGWPQQMLGDPALPSIAALNFNHNCIDVFWQAEKKPDQLAECRIFPELTKYVYFSNRVVTVPAPAPRSKETLRIGRSYSRGAESNVIDATGRLPVRTEAHDRAAIESPARFFAESLRARLIEEGIEVAGAATTGFDLLPSEQPKEVQVLDTHASPPLRELLARMMRRDLALEAEVVFKTLGRRLTERPGSFASGKQAVEQYLEGKHLPGGAPVIVDGSGRSSLDRLAPAQLVRLMQTMFWSHPAAADFIALFPQVGSEGVLADRFQFIHPTQTTRGWGLWKKTVQAPAPRLWAKPGSAVDAECLAGRAEMGNGHQVVFVLMVNGSKYPAGVLRGQLDQVVLELTR